MGIDQIIGFINHAPKTQLEQVCYILNKLNSGKITAGQATMELDKLITKIPPKQEDRDKNGQTFDQWAEDNGCY